MADNVKDCSKCGHIPHEQDKIYGKGKRLFTINAKQEVTNNCTVCGKGPKKTSRLWITADSPVLKACGATFIPPNLQVEKYPHIPK